MPKTRIIGVIGASLADKQVWQTAYEVGRLLAQNKVIIVCGGRGGVMEAACKGATEAGGMAIGILPESDTSNANPYVSICIPTGIGQARNRIIINTGEAFIAIAGSYGTLSEIAFALDSGKRVIGINTWKIEGVITANSAEEAVRLALAT